MAEMEVPPWDPDFERILRDEIVEIGSPMTTSMALSDAGLTSLGYLRLGTALADHYGVPLRVFTERAFESPASLWCVVAAQETPAHERHPDVATAAPDTAGGGGSTLAERFLATARAHPTAPCITVGTTTISYARMASDAAALSAAIPSGATVAVLGDRDVPMFRAYLAVLLAGSAVVPLSLQSPPHRNASIATTAEVAAVVYTGPVTDLDGQLSTISVAVPDAVIIHADNDHPHPPPDDIAEFGKVWPRTRSDIAYIIFTSGTTGTPKGVPIRHAHVGAFLDAIAPRYDVGVGDVFSQSHALTFDLSVFEIWGAWSTGAELRVLTGLEALTPTRTVPAFGITVFTATPSLLTTAIAAGEVAHASMPDLRYLVFCGETLPTAVVAAGQSAAPNAVIDNAYGPTEATVWATVHRYFPSERVVPDGQAPIGVAHGQMRTEVHDGELWLAGPQVFTGYIGGENDMLATDADGVRWYRTGDIVEENAGRLVHRGRRDRQLKVNGYRIEPGDVESAAAKAFEARALALAFPDGRGWGLAVESTQIDPTAARAALARRLPRYLVPDVVAVLPTFPHTAHGKVDAAALSDILQAQRTGTDMRGR
ncbi:AMP-binding protein [Rhodococcus qingshengii]|uniref:AMP-binding protein n=1 Tax=Rhodococcus qingshengii TaxID=334542 RepID=UPI001C8B15F2|nr:AMP-binding protein [Rhodococcus qingshengii]MBX9152084.1 D-alanine--poly(phosphoribitol) ligase [Rhodococcus qingshengii]